MTESSPQLDYAPKPTGLRGARARRWMHVAGGLLLLAVVLWLTPRAVHRLRVTYWQKQCMTYTAPADQVVHETDPIEVARLLAPPTPYLGSIATGQAFLIPAAYRNLVMSQSVGTAFLHERTSPQGERRLVAIDLFTTGIVPNNVMGFNATSFDPSRAVRGPRALLTLTRGDGVTVTAQPGDSFRVFAGQPDQNDPSHFTIDYEHNGTRHTLDGWLKEDGLVMIEKRE